MSHVSQLSNANRLSNLNFFQLMFGRLDTEVIDLLGALKDLNTAAGRFAELAEKLGPTSAVCQCAPVAPPALEDSCHPAGSLRASADKVTTAGGYTIEMLGRFEWKITGPDGKSTRVWGDPHVDEGDGGKWDFKRDSTFVLGDGTRVNVKTAPYGNDMTVTSSLEIISGNDRVLVGDIDKGKGKVGEVTRDGFQHVNSFSGDVIVQGVETDDWSFRGREIVGSENGGASFKLGSDLRPLAEQVRRYGDGIVWARSLVEGLYRRWADNWRPNALGADYYSGSTRPRWESKRPYDRQLQARRLRRATREMGRMLNELEKIERMNAQLVRNRTAYRVNAGVARAWWR
jgi:hypothetical protein